VRVDTATLYVRWRRERGEATAKDALRVAWWMLKYTLGVIDAARVAESALSAFRGRDEARMISECEGWFESHVRPHVCEAGRRAVLGHHAAGDVVAIVTGATPYAARPLARELGIPHVVCTRLEVAGGRFTGRFEGPLCFGAGKIELAEQLARHAGFSLGDAVFYTDSITDLPLLERVGEPVVVNPDRRLRSVARRRGWRVESW
jgi:HAD superfamily hydrolase (TIGR01490 family)